jgi:hypothetical protein
MRSFRTSPWDAYENLPRDYARIFQFEDFKRTERGVRRRAAQELTVVEVSVSVLPHSTISYTHSLAWCPSYCSSERRTSGSRGFILDNPFFTSTT